MDTELSDLIGQINDIEVYLGKAREAAEAGRFTEAYGWMQAVEDEFHLDCVGMLAAREQLDALSSPAVA